MIKFWLTHEGQGLSASQCFVVFDDARGRALIIEPSKALGKRAKENLWKISRLLSWRLKIPVDHLDWFIGEEYRLAVNHGYDPYLEKWHPDCQNDGPRAVDTLTQEGMRPMMLEAARGLGILGTKPHLSEVKTPDEGPPEGGPKGAA